MDTSTIKFHQNMLRLVKGMVSFYAEWVSDQSDHVAATQITALRKEKSELKRPHELKKPLDFD